MEEGKKERKDQERKEGRILKGRKEGFRKEGRKGGWMEVLCPGNEGLEAILFLVPV